jgi:hypothetical protein
LFSSFEIGEKKTIENKKICKERGSLPFFSCLYVWDEVLLLSSPVNVTSMLNSPLFSSPMSCISLKLCATQAWELSQALEMEWVGNELREVGGVR